MKISVTGASGQIGLPLVKELVTQGHEVKVLVYDTVAGLENLGVEFLYGNVLNPKHCEELCAGADAVFHLAAIVSINGDPNGKVWNTNVNGTKNMLDACVKQQVNKLVHFSSIHAYSTFPVHEPLDETRELASEDAFAYERSKAAAQKLVLEYVSKYNLNASVVNPTGVLGVPDHLPSVKGKMLIDFYNGKIPMLLSGGFNWVDVRDLVNTAIKAMHQGEPGECYIVGGKYYTILELSQTIGKVTGKKTPSLIAPVWLLKALLPLISFYGRVTKTEPLYTDESLKAVVEGNKYITCDKARTKLGHTNRPIEETLTDAFQWFKLQGYIA